MSNSLAIATVVGTLKARLDTAMQVDPSGVTVTLGDPAEAASTGVYLKLVRVLRNPALTGAALPTRDAQGRLRDRPMLPLTLQLAIVFTGQDMAPERLAGLVMTELEARPWLEAGEIREYLASLAEGHALASSDLASAPDRVRLSLSEMSVDEQSKLWGAFGRGYAALLVLYEASPVLLEGREGGQLAVPVLTRNFTLVAWPPTLAAIHPPGAAVAGDELILRGRKLAAQRVRVELGELRIEPSSTRADRISFVVPEAARPGAALVRVVHLDEGGDPIVTSDALSLVIAPRLGGASLTRGLGEASVTLTAVSLPEAGARAELFLIGEGVGYSSQTWTLDGDALRFTLAQEVAAGTYVVRLRLAGVFNRASSEAGLPGPRVS